MSDRTLWRVGGITETTEIDHARLAEGIRLHVIHSPLTTLTMRIGEQQRWYVVLDGCPGYERNTCRVGCPAALFRRLFQSCVSNAALHVVASPQGLARRPYTRGVFAWPLAEAEPLDSSMIEHWADARLLMHWRRYGPRVCGSLLLLTSADGQDPVKLLRTRHWRPVGLPASLVTRWSQAALPPALPFGAPWPQSLFLLLPALRCPETARSDADDTTPHVGGGQQP